MSDPSGTLTMGSHVVIKEVPGDTSAEIVAVFI